MELQRDKREERERPPVTGNRDGQCLTGQLWRLIRHLRGQGLMGYPFGSEKPDSFFADDTSKNYRLHNVLSTDNTEVETVR